MVDAFGNAGAMAYQGKGVPLVVVAGKEYGTGSSRDWAAKGTKLLGVRAVIVESFERIHRSNLVGTGILPLQFKPGTSRKTLLLDGSETSTVRGLDRVRPRQDITVEIARADGGRDQVVVTCRIDTLDELSYINHGGILPYVLHNLASAQGRAWRGRDNGGGVTRRRCPLHFPICFVSVV